MYFKITNEEENHHGLQYQDGIVEDISPFNDNPNDSCCPGGIYFTDEENILNFLAYGVWIRQVEIPEDAKFIKDPDGDKWRANKLFFHPRRKLYYPETLDWLLKNNVNIWNEDCILYLLHNGYINAIKHLVVKKEQHSDYIHFVNDILLYAVKSGKIDIVKFALKKGAYIHISNTTPIFLSLNTGYFEIAELLIENGTDISKLHYTDTYSLLDNLMLTGCDISTLNFVLSKNVRPTYKTLVRCLALHSSKDYIKVLLNHKYDIDYEFIKWRFKIYKTSKSVKLFFINAFKIFNLK